MLIYAYVNLLETLEKILKIVDMWQIESTVIIVFSLLKTYLTILIQICDQKSVEQECHFP